MKKLLLFLCALVLVLGTVISAGALEFDGRDYVVMQFAGESWSDATDHMLSELGSHYHLATITSAEEQQFIQNILLENITGEYWLGGYQVPNDQPVAGASWWWVNNEGKFWDEGAVDEMYYNWAGGEPNDAYGDGSEQYLAMWSNFQWGWNDEKALGNISGYIAESRPVPEPTTIMLLGCGIAGLVGYGRKKRQRS